MTNKSTTISKKESKEALVICSCCRLPESMDANTFHDSIVLDNTWAAFFVEMFPSNLHNNGFKDEFILRTWI
jgi:transcription elongation factor Elf1